MNKFGKEVDASIYASRPNTICLSAFRIAPKLIKETAQKEILALLIHELSHFLGATEIEAVEIQKLAAIRLQRLSEDSSKLQHLLWVAPDALDGIYLKQEAIKNKIGMNDLSGIRSELNSILLRLLDFDDYLGQLQLGFGDYRIYEFEHIILSKMRLATIFVESLDANYEFQQDSKNEYEECFANSKTITVSELEKNCDLSFVNEKNIYSFMEIKKLENLSDLNEFLIDVFLFAHDLNSHVRSIVYTDAPVFFHLPGVVNSLASWEKFIGSYKIIEKNCTSSWPSGFNSFERLETVEISMGLQNYPVMNEKAIVLTETGSGSKSTQYMTNGGGSYDTMLLFGDSQSASMTDEYGSRWYDRQGHGWNKTTKKIESINGELYITMKKESASYDYNGFSQADYQCQFKLN